MAKSDKRPFYAADCETDPFKYMRVPKPFIWGLYTGAGFHEFATAEEFVAFIRDLPVIIYFHNGGKFDLHFLLNWLNLDEKVTVINGRLVVAHIGKAEIRDSWNLLPVPLADIAKDDFDYTILEERVRNKPGNMLKIRKYLRSDCVHLWNAVDKFERTYGRHLTQAGASMKTWEKMSEKLRPETNRGFFRKFSEYYYGGRVECFERGKIEGPYSVYDIKSAYPDAMCSEHPFSGEYHVTKSPKEIRPTSMVTVRCRSAGALPYRADSGAMYFPADHELKVYHCTGHELLAGIETNTVSDVEIIEAIDFVTLYSFRSFIQWCDDNRSACIAAGDDAGALFWKLLENSLYGKFAANPDNYGNFKCVPMAQMEDYLTDGFAFDGMIGPHALLKAPLDEWQSKFINVATAASITGQVRAKLWRALCGVERKMYCDTDSIICANAPRLDIGNTLGKWQHEGTGHTLYIAGKKTYLCDGITTKKGKPKMATKGVRLTPEQIKRVALGETVVYEPEAPTFRLRDKPVFQTRKVRATA